MNASISEISKMFLDLCEKKGVYYSADISKILIQLRALDGKEKKLIDDVDELLTDLVNNNHKEAN